VHRDRWQDTVGSSAALAGISLPDFFWGIVLILLFSRWLGWLPSSGYASPTEDFGLALRHALLPSIALGLSLMAHLTRMTRSAMLEVMSQDFIRVCRAKGLGEGAVIFRHALRNAISPVVTVAGLQLGYLFGSIIVIESLFNYTGMGWLTYQALLNRDVPLIQSTVFVIATAVMLSNLIVDVIYTLLDPRIGLE
jgi:peptide/nickel transport system permease protein